MPRVDKKAQLVEVAIEHFNRNGFHATGVDLVLAASGIAKTTLYRHFPSKEDLIVEVLRVPEPPAVLLLGSFRSDETEDSAFLGEWSSLKEKHNLRVAHHEVSVSPFSQSGDSRQVATGSNRKSVNTNATPTSSTRTVPSHRKNRIRTPSPTQYGRGHHGWQHGPISRGCEV